MPRGGAPGRPMAGRSSNNWRAERPSPEGLLEAIMASQREANGIGLQEIPRRGPLGCNLVIFARSKSICSRGLFLGPRPCLLFNKRLQTLIKTAIKTSPLPLPSHPGLSPADAWQVADA